MKLNTLIKKKRILRGVTQFELALKLGYGTPQFVSNCERDKCSYPASKFKTLSKYLDIPIKTLILAKVAAYRDKILRVVN